MSTLFNFDGIMGSTFRVGGSSGNSIKAETFGLSIRDSAGSTLKNLAIARARASTPTDAAAYLDVQEKVLLIQFSFAGSSPPSPGSNTGNYGFCHTSGGSFNAGGVYLDTGSALVAVTIYKTQSLCTTSAISGTVSLVTNGFYIAQSNSAPYSWTLKGDGAPASTGIEQSIELSVTTTTGVTSTTSIPTNAEVRESLINVTSAYSIGATIQVNVNGSVPLTVMDTTENDPTTTGIYIKPQDSLVSASNAGVLIVNIGGSPGTGASRIIVKYITTFLG